MTSIWNKTKQGVYTALFCLLFALAPVPVGLALDVEQELRGIGMDKGWLLVEGIGLGGGNASSRRERAYQNALDTYIRAHLLFTETDRQRYANIRDSVLQKYADFLIKDQADSDFHYEIIEKGRNEQNQEFTRLHVLIQRDALAAHLEELKVIEKISLLLQRSDNPRILFVPEQWKNISLPHYEKALQRFEGILSKRGLRLISSQELHRLWVQDEALKKLITQAKHTPQNSQALLARSNADILVLYQLDTQETNRIQTRIFYQSKLNIRVLDNNTGQTKKTWAYQSGDWGLPPVQREVLEDSTILEVIHPAADEIATFLRQQWTELKSARLFSLNLKGAAPLNLEQIQHVFKNSCHIQSLTLQQAQLQCPFTKSEFEEILNLEPYWEIIQVQPYIINFIKN